MLVESGRVLDSGVASTRPLTNVLLRRVYDERVANDAAYPSILPSVGDSLEGDIEAAVGNVDSQCRSEADSWKDTDVSINHAPPGYVMIPRLDNQTFDRRSTRPAYAGLKNNVSTMEMEMQTHSWNPGTEEFVLHNFMADYIQDAARVNAAEGVIQFNTRVQSITKSGARWHVVTSKLEGGIGKLKPVVSQQVCAIRIMTTKIF